MKLVFLIPLTVMMLWLIPKRAVGTVIPAAGTVIPRAVT